MSTSKFDVQPLQDGTIIVIKGKIPADCESFSFNLLTANDDHVSISTHYDLNGQIVRDAFVNGKWTGQETDGPAFQAPKGSNIQFRIRCNADNYEVSIDGTQYFSFNHRIPKEQITSLAVDKLDDVTVHFEVPTDPDVEEPMMAQGESKTEYCPQGYRVVYYQPCQPAYGQAGGYPGGACPPRPGGG